MSSNVWRQTEFDFGDVTSPSVESSDRAPSVAKELPTPPDRVRDGAAVSHVSGEVTSYELNSSKILKSLDNSSSVAGSDIRLEAHRRRIAGYLSCRLPEPVDIIFTNNRSTMVSFRRLGGRLLVRLHRMFRHSNEKILDALALFLGKKDPEASAQLDEFFREHQHEIRSSKRARPRRLRAQGAHQDLQAIFDRVNQTYFDGRIETRIGWGRAPSKRSTGRRRRRTVSRALATYSFDDQTIRVSPVLDDPDIPDYVLDWIVYHEMLHHVLPVEKKRGKCFYHTKRFHLLERAFARYEEAKSWEKANMEKLLF